MHAHAIFAFVQAASNFVATFSKMEQRKELQTCRLHLQTMQKITDSSTLASSFLIKAAKNKHCKLQQQAVATFIKNAVGFIATEE